MVMFRKNRVSMRRYCCIFVYCLAAFAFLSCVKDPVKAYDEGDSAVYFLSPTNVFSLIGKSGDEIELTIPVNLIGPVSDHDREIALEIKDSTAFQNVDFFIVSSKVEAGALSGNIVLRVKALPENVEELYARFTIVPNDSFPETFRRNTSSVVGWTASYARPREEVWRYWFLFFCNGYSKSLHKIIVEELGTEADTYTGSKKYATDSPELTYKLPTWWYSASRQLYDAVAAHDKADPEHPYMHSSDYELYDKWSSPIGGGTKPENIPTILETLKVM